MKPRPESLPVTIQGTLIVLLSLLTAVTAQASQPKDFQWTAPLSGEVRASEPARVPLPATVIAKVRPGFPDLRLYDGQGKETPYVIYEDIAPAVPEKILSLTVKEFVETEATDQFVVEKAQRSDKIDSLEVLTSARDFKKNVRVEGSPDGQSWNPLTEDAIFDYSSRVSLRKTTLSIPATEAHFFRITITKEAPIPNETDQIHLQYRDLEFSSKGSQSQSFRVDGFNAHSGGRQQDSRIEDKVTLTQLEITHEDKGTACIELGEIHLPLSIISLEVEDTFFFRPIEVQVSTTGKEDSYQTFFSGVIHRIPGAAKPGLQLEVDFHHAPFVRLLVRDGDNPPLNIRSVHLIWNQRVLYFHPRQEETYALYFGNKDVTSPKYETAHLISNDASVLRALPEWSVSAVVENAAFSPSWGKSDRDEFQGWMLNTLVVALLVGLGLWGVTILKRLPKSG